ncbi:MAG TPA: MlaD family protein [Solirubrobacteraceae bacterium]
MQKQAPTLGRLLVMVGFALSCFGLLLFLWLAFGGPIPLSPKGWRFQTSFAEGTQLAKEADVRISGVSVGKVKTITTQPNGTSKAVIQLNAKYAPIPKDSKAILRQKTLLGETYVELTPGNKKNGVVKENGTLPGSHVSSTVELDEIFRAFDPKTRDAFRTWMQQQALAIQGRGYDINDALGNLSGFAVDTNVLLQILNAQKTDVRGIVNNTGSVFDALTARDGQLRQLISNNERVFSTTAARNRDLADFFRILPTFEREATTTTQRLDRFAHFANPVVTQLRPAAHELSPTLQQLSALAPDLKALFRDLNPVITLSKRSLPALERFTDELHPLLAELDSPLRQLTPALTFISRYPDELVAFFANTVAATQASDLPAKAKGPVHYLRTENPFNPENLAVYPHRIGSNRPNPYELPDAFLNTGKLPVYEDRQCGNGTPTLSPGDAQTLLGQPVATIFGKITQFAFANAATGGIPAPPCKKQGPQPGVNAGDTIFPHVLVDPPAAAGRKK